ncbi:4-oxalocrotonate tautomerase DmpI [Pelobacter propionicus]|uniref:4-oxalocrotonate tautomerase n=1 Tax=Pelobacter propionicus (strain DSM 2379 / NBRC 103807 / OttBd1) TaxID=338966 RepID=A1AMW0_PELPD|nr:4-oxalocrotonate tautomerase DmpI [Pelobacter propionicus]ABK98680.1 4-oxalocrotonate tautomerase [Pelobacter propionicus DSM 2379]
MPVITIDMHSTDTETKKALIKNVTKTAAETTNIPAEKFTILINELDSVNIGVGGLTLAEIKAAQAR